ncbi:DUF6458 family protein [Nocardioides donggukensis]|uniref:DUF6458 domain-containing protein n=1 Tax=Nocardioides donggukensis TaxID=2774019 RepID=A0A927K7H3_9ACTN|nr:DUF6458 family protein [Nocardioides donggukensis]MBD8869095.1 hypothetical protein [Nocardioides donggukensis]
MGYGLGVFLMALGLILAFAVSDVIEGVDLTMVGYILVLAGILIVALTAFQANRGRSASNVTRTTHADGRQTVTEQRNESDPPPAV